MEATGKGIALVLGGGGARGWAHLGVLRQLRHMKVPIGAVFGSSAGAMVGAACAAGRLETLEEVARHLDWQRTTQLFLELGLPRAGLTTGRNIERLLQEILAVDRIEDLQVPFAAVATDLYTAEEVVLSCGELVPAVRASISLPGIFSPVSLNGRTLIDGAMVNPLPVSVARRNGSRAVLAVDVNLRPGVTGGREARKAKPAASRQARQRIDDLVSRLPKIETPAFMRRWVNSHPGPSIFDVLTLSTRVVENAITRTRLLSDPPDLLIQPAVGHINTLDFHKAEAIIAAGEAAVRHAAPQIERLMESA